MRDVVAVFSAYRPYFPDSSGVVAAALFNGEQALPDQVAIVKAVLDIMQLPYRVVDYTVYGQGEERPPLHGTLVVHGTTGQTLRVYLGGKKLELEE